MNKYQVRKSDNVIVGVNSNFGSVKPEYEILESLTLYDCGDIFGGASSVELPAITKLQLRTWFRLKRNNMDVGVVIPDLIRQYITDPLQQGLALDAFEFAQEYKRGDKNDPNNLFNSIGAALGMTPNDVDQMFVEAKLL